MIPPLGSLRPFSGHSGELRELPSCRYVTDGRRLFRVVSRLPSRGRGGLAELEDCLTLRVACYTERELATMRLRAVTAGGG